MIIMKMKLLILAILIGIQFSACKKNDSFKLADNSENPSNINTSKMKITIGDAIFKATLYDNPTTAIFKAKLPLEINMTELNGNEKYYHFSSFFPTNATLGDHIKAGDLMLFGNNSLVLFYENFNTSYSYTKLGYVENTTELASALGSGNVVVKFENN